MFYNLHCPYDYVNFNLSSILILALAKFLCICVLSCFSHVQLFVTLWTVACQAPLSMGFSRQEYWSGLPCPPPGDLSDSGIEPMSLMSPALQADSLPLSHWGSPIYICIGFLYYT